MSIRRPTLLAAILVAPLPAQLGMYTPSGSGCPIASCSANMIYESMRLNALDLDGTPITFVPSATTYTANFLGTALTLSSAATDLGAGTSTVSGAINLGFSMPHPGPAGSTSAVQIATNGLVFLDPTTVTNGILGGSLFRSFRRAPTIGVLGSQLDPTRGGRVAYESLVATNPVHGGNESVFVVEWQGIPLSSGNPVPMTFQTQLWQSGAIVIAHSVTTGQTVSQSCFVGVSVGGDQPDCAGLDFTTDLPFTPTAPFLREEPVSLEVSGRFYGVGVPAIGRPITLSASPVPNDGVGVLGLGARRVSIPLSTVGSPAGCELLIDSVFFTLPMSLRVATTSSLTTTFVVPLDATSLGLAFEMQTFVTSPTIASPLPVLTSNRVSATVGTTQTNDDCSVAFNLPSIGTVSGHNVGATTSPQTGSCGMTDDVWYRYVARCSGTVTCSLCYYGSTTFDAAIAAFTGSCGALTEIACNDNSCGLGAEVTFAATQGQSFLIAVGSAVNGGNGGFTVYVECR